MNHKGWSNIKRSHVYEEPSGKEGRWSSGTIVSVDGQRSYTVEDDATGTHYSRYLVHIKPIPGDASTPPTAKVSSERLKKVHQCQWICQASRLRLACQHAEPEIPMKQKVDNQLDSIKASRPRRIIKAPVKNGYD